jgi:hypothetical protein
MFEEIKCEIASAPFVATTDIASKSQLSTMFR